MGLSDDIDADLSANQFDADKNPHMYEATFTPEYGVPVSLTIGVYSEDSLEIDGYQSQVTEERVIIEYLRTDIDLDVKRNEKFTITDTGRIYIVDGIQERDDHTIRAFAK